MSLTDVPGILVGHAQDPSGRTGCTVVLCTGGGTCGVDVRGGGPATRETDLLRPGNLVEKVHALLLTGGSAFGLEAAGGVMRWLEERGIGFDTGFARVPIVPAAAIYDLPYADGAPRPDAALAYTACQAAAAGPVAEGSVGAGAGATVGKIFGRRRAMKGGLGTASLAIPGGPVVAALCVVNAAGDVWDGESGRIVAGARGDDGSFLDCTRMLLSGEKPAAFRAENTTLCVVATTARLSKEQCTRVAAMAQDGLARAISPVHTQGDGDLVFCLSLGDDRGDVSLVGTAAAVAVERAIVRAVRMA